MLQWTCVHDIHTQALRGGQEEEEEEGSGSGSASGSHSSAGSPPSSAASSARTHPPAAWTSICDGVDFRPRPSPNLSTQPAEAGGAGGRGPADGEDGMDSSSPRRAWLARMASTLSPRPLEATGHAGGQENGGGPEERDAPSGDSVVDSSSEEEDGYSDEVDSDSSEEGESSRSAEGRPGGNNQLHHHRDPGQGRAPGFRRLRISAVRWLSASDSIFSYFMWTHRPRSLSWEAVQSGGSGSSSVDMPNESAISSHLSAEQRERAVHYVTSRQERPRPTRHWQRDILQREYQNFRRLRFDLQQGHKYKSKPRLIYSQQEPNVGRGFIKEQCFSTDGRLIVSPWGNGIRLLSFDEKCRELCDCIPSVAGQPRRLHELREVSMHSLVVLTTRFSPTQPLFVSGSLDGSVAFMTPCP